jgi:hypothetical protein
VLELKETADVITAVALDQPQGTLGERAPRFLPRKYAGQILFSQINDRDQLGIAADTAFIDFLVHAGCKTLSGRQIRA